MSKDLFREPPQIKELIEIHIPDAWDTEIGTRFGTIITAISKQISNTTKSIQYINDMLGIDSTIGDDLDARWGSLLGINRRYGESDNKYRNRLKTSVLMLKGGTATALRYATLVALNKDMYPYVDDNDSNIQILDAWDYNGLFEIDKTFGNVVILIDATMVDMAMDDRAYTDLYDILNSVKATGVNITLIWTMADSEEYGLAQCAYDEWGIYREPIFEYNDGDLLINIDDINGDHTIFSPSEATLSADDDYDTITIIEL